MTPRCRIADHAHILITEYLAKDIQHFGSKEQRVDAWIVAVQALDPEAAASRATWHRYKNENDRDENENEKNEND